MFGLAQFAGADLVSGTIQTVVYDNLSLTLSTVPESASWAMMLLGFGALGAAARSKRQRSGAPA